MGYEDLRQEALKVHQDALRQMLDLYQYHLLEERETLELAYKCLNKISSHSERPKSLSKVPTIFINIFICLLFIVCCFIWPEILIEIEIFIRQFLTNHYDKFHKIFSFVQNLIHEMVQNVDQLQIN